MSKFVSSVFKVIHADDNGNAVIKHNGDFFIVHVNEKEGKFESLVPYDVEHACFNSFSMTTPGLFMVSCYRSRRAAYSQWKRHVMKKKNQS